MSNQSSRLIRVSEIGRVTQVKKCIAQVEGLLNFMNGQLVTFSNGPKGMVMGFNSGQAYTLILDEEDKVKLGQEVSNSSEQYNIPVSHNIIGSIVNAYAQALDGKCQITESSGQNLEYRNIFNEAAAVLDREISNSSFDTGTKIIDTVLPISKGQRQLLVGDRMTGKTTIAVDAILNQKNRDIVCIYCCIGKSFSSLQKVIDILRREGALDYTVVIAADASSSISQQYFAPYTAAAIGEYFMYRRKDVFVVFDDLTKHAWAYRQLSLLMERCPGRESYPGDIFYAHSQLMERAGKLNQKLGAGSMTFFPIIETIQGNISGFIPSNLVSMTDGQVYFNTVLFNEGLKPAIDILLSVSRLGNKSQNPLLRELAAGIRFEYSQYRELLRLTRLRTDLSPEVQAKIKRGNVLTEIFTQEKNRPVCWQELVILLYAFSKKILTDLDLLALRKFKNEIFNYILTKDSQLIAEFDNLRQFNASVQSRLNQLLVDYFRQADAQGG